MRFRDRMIVYEFLGGASGGLFLAVQGLFFMEKGVEVWQIGLLFGMVGVVTAVLELPFGALADIYGRIRIYRVSVGMFLLAALVAIFAQSFWHLLAAMALIGVSQALNSGSIDAWAVERIKENGDEEKLQSFMSVFQAAMATGLAAGAIGGGYVPTLFPALEGFPPTTWNLILIAVLLLGTLVLTPWLFHEGERLAPRENDDMYAQVRAGVKLGLQNVVLRDLLVLGMVLGFAIMLVEAYWQPRLTLIAGAPTYAVLGWTTGGYFAMAIVGPMLVTMVAGALKAEPSRQLLVLPLFLAGALYVLALQNAVGPFVAAYMAVMLFVSMFNPPAVTLLNEHTPDEVRSTMQSIFSLTMRGGGAVAAFGFAALVKLWGIVAIWQIVAGLVLLTGVWRMLAQRGK